MSSSTSGNTNSAQATAENNLRLNSAAKSNSTAAIFAIVLGTIVAVAIVVAVIYCLKRATKSILSYYAPVRIGQSDQAANERGQSKDYYGAADAAFPVIRDSQLEAGTMERFLGEIAREKPIRFAPQQLAGFTRDFSKVLGSGGFGVVYEGQFPNGVLIAVKVLNNSSGKRLEEQFMAEVGTIGRTYHFNLVRLYGFCFDPTMRALVYEYMKNGSLDRFLFAEPRRAIEWEKLQEIAIGTAKGIAYLHEECQKRIIHYDIKPGNVLLDSNLKPKVADFGLAKLCNRDSTHVVMSGCRGTPGYAAPELWTPYPVTHKCDVYSFGMLLFEIVGRRRNYDANLSGGSQEWLPRWTYEKLKKNELSDMISTCGISAENREKAERMVMVALWCVQYLPTERPNMSVVVKMLEGGVEIATPPNPFGHLEEHNNLAVVFNSGSGSNADPSNQPSSENSYYTACLINTAKRTTDIEM
ncbi:hypothetical protein Nepgr_031237 [Nepenthes gracilis]|uniref:Protein kinase domain-containing protein n=1 Tax=Nepenthes gracilis TaxID=150966 RepID=A0AAD3THQ1_NEPGR|nr:hypothetical protein Nepgr_031237 [Nepenthes gracilis]